MFSIHDIIALAVRLEENGEAAYRNAFKSVKDPAIRGLLESLADEEMNHARWFSGLKEALETDEEGHIFKEIGRSLANDFFADQTFSLKDIDFTSIQSLKKGIQIAIDFEKDSILFYEMLAPFIDDPNASETLRRIITEETIHIQKLKDLLPKIPRISE